MKLYSIFFSLACVGPDKKNITAHTPEQATPGKTFLASEAARGPRARDCGSRLVVPRFVPKKKARANKAFPAIYTLYLCMVEGQLCRILSDYTVGGHGPERRYLNQERVNAKPRRKNIQNNCPNPI